MTNAVALEPPAEVLPASTPEEVRVRGARASAPTESPLRTRVERERLAEPGMRLGEALRIVPGVAVRETGAYGAFSSVALRGGTAAQTPVYLGTVLLNDDVAGTADLSAFLPAMLERVDVHRGHAPLELDRLGLGGAIVLVPRAPRESFVEAAGTAGTLGHLAGHGLVGGVEGDDSFALMIATDRASNRYAFTDDRGTAFDRQDDRVALRENADASNTSALASGSFAPGDARVRALAFGSLRDQGVPRLAVLPSVAARLRQDRLLTAADATLPLDARGTLGLRATGTWARSDYTDPYGELGLGAASLALRGRRYDQRLSYDFHGTSVRLFAAIGAVQDALDRRSGASLEAERLTGRAQLGASLPLGAGFEIDAALGHDELREKAAGAFVVGETARGDRVTTGRLVLRWSAAQTSAFLVAARYARAPTLGERFGVDGVVQGNPLLAPERGLSADLVVRHAFGPDRRVRLEAVGFARALDDLIDFTRTSPGTVRPVNVAGARILGAELAADVRALAWLELGAVSTLLDAQDTTAASTLANRRLPFRARHIESAFVRVFSNFSTSRSLRFEWRTNVEGARTVDPAGLAILPAQQWSDASLRGRIDAIDLGVRFGNVFDATRVDLVGYPLPGRTVDLSLGGVLP